MSYDPSPEHLGQYQRLQDVEDIEFGSPEQHAAQARLAGIPSTSTFTAPGSDEGGSGGGGDGRGFYGNYGGHYGHRSTSAAATHPRSKDRKKKIVRCVF